MRRIALLFLPLLLAGTLAAKPKDEVALEIVLEKPEYALSDKIEIGFKLVNKGKEPVYVNTRFKLGTPAAAPAQKELVLEVREAGGAALEMKVTDYESGIPKSEYFVLLKPGEEAAYDRKWDLKDLAKIEKPGAYEVKAAYRNAWGKELGLDVFPGPAAATATVKVKEG
ncbi:MAG: hypothetical protein HYZ94_02725 [Candidatus Omnitrophica bacterium]|nr:hypothetical protein [Candidatus Omnitrophota bacterium]